MFNIEVMKHDEIRVIDNYFPDNNIIVVGDFNDDLTDIQKNNVFQQFLNFHLKFLPTL